MKLHNILYLKWRNFLYRNIPARISDRLDTESKVNFIFAKRVSDTAKSLEDLENRVKHLEMLEKHRR